MPSPHLPHSPRPARVAALALALALATTVLTSCDIQIHEQISATGEEPIWFLDEVTGGDCLADGEQPRAGQARYPRGRVPVWVNPPDSYAHRSPEGGDAYAINPNDPAYPWFDQVLAEHPELACAPSDPVKQTLPLHGAGKTAVAVVIHENAVGNRCLGFGDPGTGEPVDGLSGTRLSVIGQVTPTWTSTSATELLRVATSTCLTIDAEATTEDGTVLTLSDAGYGECDPAYGDG